MDYTPISTRRVLLGFGFTAVIALLPILFVLLRVDGAPVGTLIDAVGGYRGLVLGAGSIITTLLVGLVTAVVVVARRVVRRPTRA